MTLIQFVGVDFLHAYYTEFDANGFAWHMQPANKQQRPPSTLINKFAECPSMLRRKNTRNVCPAVAAVAERNQNWEERIFNLSFKFYDRNSIGFDSLVARDSVWVLWCNIVRWYCRRKCILCASENSSAIVSLGRCGWRKRLTMINRWVALCIQPQVISDP